MVSLTSGVRPMVTDPVAPTGSTPMVYVPAVESVAAGPSVVALVQSDELRRVPLGAYK